MKFNGLKIGLEIHFQLQTNRKLFCNCPVGLTEVEGSKVIRKLRPTQSELGQIDPAAYFEFQKGVTIEYIVPNNHACLVELDEEPPHEICLEALYIALAVSKYFNCHILDEFEVMRKVVIDGSNPTGFQRTLVVALNGYINIDGKKVGIQSVCLEEEAARLVKRKNNVILYSLDRLGIPLIEIATAPDINSPEEAVKVAEYIGRVVSATGKRRRGIGSIRQDINISVKGGNVVEVKGVQKLSQLKKVIEFEYKRQCSLIEIKDIVNRRGIKPNEIISKYHDITELFRTTRSRLITKLLRGGNHVYAIKIPKFRGLLGMEIAPGYRLGTEIAERIRFWTGLGGIIHSDELPGYQINNREIIEIKKRLGCGDMDAFILIISDEEKARIAMDKIIERIKETFNGVPEETRASREDGTTYYMRPKPGMARMYPETDIPPIPLSDKVLNEVSKIKIISPEETIKLLMDKYGINRELASKIYDLEMIELYSRIMETTKKLKPTFIASLLTETLKYLEREGLDVSKLNDNTIIDTIKYVERGEIEKELITDIWREILASQLPIKEVIKKYAVTKIHDEEIKNYLLNVIKEKNELLKLPKNVITRRLIGIAMSKYRGHVDPQRVIKIVETILKNVGG